MSLAERYHRSVLPTHRQYEYLLSLHRFIERHHCAPALRELAVVLGVKSLTAVVDALDGLEAKGMIRRPVKKPRAMYITEAGKNFLIMMESS